MLLSAVLTRLMHRNITEYFAMALHPDVPCAFEFGDRVAHRLYGTGSVTSPPSATMLMSKMSLRLEPNGWRMDVSWDDERWAPCRIGSAYLAMVTHQNSELHEVHREERLSLLRTWQGALKAVDDHVSTPRSARDRKALKLLQRREDEAWHSMRRHSTDGGTI
jgi:hypothetical protein